MDKGALDIFGLEELTDPIIKDKKVATESVTFDSDNEKERLSGTPISIENKESGRVFTVDLFHGVSEYSNYHELIGYLETAIETDIFIIRIASPGGRISIGTIIASAVIACKGTVIGVSMGKVCSVASLLWSSCDKQAIMDGSLFLFHMSSHGDSGVSTDIKERTDRLIKYVIDYLLEVSVRKGHMTEDELSTIITKSKDIIINSINMKARMQGTPNYIEDFEGYVNS